MNLAELQRSLQAHLVEGDNAIAQWINESERVPTATRLGIYSHAYRQRLIDALRENFPVLHEVLGDDDFDTLGGDYLQNHPSQRRSIRWFGDRLAETLAEKYPEHRWLDELARWEWAIAHAFDAADATSLGFEAMQSVGPAEWPVLVFELHPSLRRLDLFSNIVQLYQAHANATEMPAPSVEETMTAWLIWRQDATTRYRSLAADEAAALDRARGGGTFEQICERLCDWHDAEAVPLKAASYLKTWIADGLVVELERA